MSETARMMLIRGVAAAHAGDLSEAKRYLERVLYNDASRDQRAQAHLWLSRLTDDPGEQRDHLEEVLAADPTDGEARRALAILDGRLNPEDIIDPDRIGHTPLPTAPLEGDPQDAAAPAQPTAAQRLVCPKCGGQVRFEPGKSWVECRYCGHRQPLLSALQSRPALDEEDIVVALAQRKGHAVPQGVRAFRCQGCQAALVTASAISTHCPYCGSVHIVAVASEAMIPPEGVIPFELDAAAAQASFRAWLDRELGDRQLRTTRVRGLYLPLWTFDLMGEIAWRGVEPNDGGGPGLGFSIGEGGLHVRVDDLSGLAGGRQLREGGQYVMVDDIVVPATHKVPYTLRAVFDSFELTRAVPYEPAYLSDWPAELYEIAVGDASLVARQRVLADARKDIEIRAETRYGKLQQFQVFPRSLAVQSYRLLLVPVWLANYRHENETYTVVVNGQNGVTSGEEPPSGLRRLLTSLFGGEG